MKIALITGLEFEASLARKAGKDQADGVVVGVAGLGAPFVGKAVADAKAAGVRGIVSFGVCGGLDPALPAGSVILPQTILAPQELPVDLVWRDRLQEVLSEQYDITTRPLLTVKETVTSVEQKAELFTQTGACAVDMESAVLARQAAKNGLSFIAVRVVHDPASQAIPAAFADIINPNGQINVWKMIKGLAFSWPGAKVLQELSVNDKQARTNLAGLTRLALPDFGFR